MRLDRGSGLLCGVVIGVRLCLPSGLAAGVGMGVVEAEACFIRGSGLGVRAVSARSRAARARASGEDGSEEIKGGQIYLDVFSCLMIKVLLSFVVLSTLNFAPPEGSVLVSLQVHRSLHSSKSLTIY